MTRKNKIYKTKKVTVIFVEGDADELMMNRLLDYYRATGWRCDGDIEIVNSNGFPTEAKMTSRLRQIECRFKDVVVRFKTVFYEYDSDVFEIQHQQQPDWCLIEKHLKEKFDLSGFCRIEAKTSIEDWMLDDAEGLLNSLNLPPNTKLKGKFGQDKVSDLSDLFRKKNIIYHRHKGKSNIQKYIEILDIGKIKEARKKELREFERVLGGDSLFGQIGMIFFVNLQPRWSRP